MKTYFISGHLDLTFNEFSLHYVPYLQTALIEDPFFVVGDAIGADSLAQKYLLGKSAKVLVYHMFESPRNNAGFETCGGFMSDKDRDTAMTLASTHDIAWVRPGRKNSGTEKNLRRRKNALEGVR